eukprot:6577547-Alexandrium_andersonii.AAC.1
MALHLARLDLRAHLAHGHEDTPHLVVGAREDREQDAHEVHNQQERGARRPHRPCARVGRRQ